MTLFASHRSKGNDVYFFACAINEKGQIAQILSERKNNVMTDSWTGKIYKSQKEANADLARLNDEAARKQGLKEKYGVE